MTTWTIKTSSDEIDRHQSKKWYIYVIGGRKEKKNKLIQSDSTPIDNDHHPPLSFNFPEEEVNRTKVKQEE